jgi:hypothetical protein
MNPRLADDEERGFWLQRLEATGRAQSRYLWILLVAGLFYAALRVGGGNTDISVPIVDLQLRGSIVLGSGGPVLAFLVLVVVGAIRAWTHAIEQIRGAPVTRAEQLDAHPNAIDLAVYTTSQTPKVIRHLLSLSYPLFLTAGLAESAWLGWSAWSQASVGRPYLLVAMVLTWLPAAALVLGMWRNRLHQFGAHDSAA